MDQVWSLEARLKELRPILIQLSEFDFLRAAWKEIYVPITNARWNFLTKML